jgi:hypothetical protein
MLKSFGSQYSMSRTCGPRDVISLVIPRLGDNMDHRISISFSCNILTHNMQQRGMDPWHL